MKQNSYIFEDDKRSYEQEIEQSKSKDYPVQILCSFAYLTPNYSVLFTLNELKRITDKGNFRVFIVFWDMNTLVHPYFKKSLSNGKISDPNKYIQDKMIELEKITESIGFDMKKVLVYKSSELWRRLITYKDENLFQDFYSVLSEIKVQEYMTEMKISNLLQIPMDIFFANNFDKLCPEDTERPIDIIFSSNNKRVIYDMTRKQMYENGLIKSKKPLIMLMDDFPYMMHKSYVPEWNMSKKEINNIISNFNLSKSEMWSILRNISLDDREIKISTDQSNENMKKLISEGLFEYLKRSKAKYNQVTDEINEQIISITKKDKLKEIGQVIKSDIALNILLLSDGTKTTTEISKILKKSVATISTYTARLKKLDLIRVLSNNKLKRNIKGVKFNLDFGMDD